MSPFNQPKVKSQLTGVHFCYAFSFSFLLRKIQSRVTLSTLSILIFCYAHFLDMFVSELLKPKRAWQVLIVLLKFPLSLVGTLLLHNTPDTISRFN